MGRYELKKGRGVTRQLPDRGVMDGADQQTERIQNRPQGAQIASILITRAMEAD
jgi:hypothetical protein